MDDLAIRDGDNRTEAVVVRLSSRSSSTVNLVLEDDDARIPRRMDHEPVSAMQLHSVALQRCHIRGAALKAFGPIWKSITELEDGINGHGVPEMVASDTAIQPLHDDVEERIQIRELVILRRTHAVSSSAKV